MAMAFQRTKELSVSEDLKKLLSAELEHRSQFSQSLAKLLIQRNEEQTSGEQTVDDLRKKMGSTDDTISSQLRDLCLDQSSPEPCDVVNRREAKVRPEPAPDSGYSASPTSSDNLDNTKRQGLVLRASNVPVPPTETQLVLSDMPAQSSLSTSYTALGHDAKVPTEHSDSSSQDDTS